MAKDEGRLTSAVKPGVESGTAAWAHRHVLDLDDFSREEIELVLGLSHAMKEVLGREVSKVPTLRGKRVVILFYEPSTRTRVSFELAAKSLNADVVNITAAGSSVQKGESLVDTLRTLQALGADAIVMRHWQSGAPHLAARHLGLPVINAGDGTHAHPTQALLDIYTIRQHVGSLEGIKVVIVGDILHSRVARSNMWGLSLMGARVTLCGPPPLLPTSWLNQGPSPVGTFPGHTFTVDMDLDRAMEGAQVVMALRLQKERQQTGLLPSLREYIRLYQVTEARMARARPGAVILHPGPANEGVEIATEVLHGSHSVVEEQVSNGVAVRMALLYLLCGGKRP